MAGEWIRDYERIRPMLEHIYTYGFYSRDDFDREDIVKKSKYDKDLQRVSRIFGCRLILHSDGKRQYLSIERDYFSNRAPWLIASYFLRGIKSSQLKLLLLTLGHLPASQTEVQRLAEQLPDATASDKTATFWRQLQELVDLGYICKFKSTYSFPDDPLEDLSDDELICLYQMADFFACSGLPRTPGEFLRRSILREMAVRGLESPGEAFLFRENCCRTIFDEQTAFILVRACVDQMVITAENRGKPIRLLPFSMKFDIRMGRWYVEGINIDTGRAMRLRLHDLTKCALTGQKAPAGLSVEAAQQELAFSYLSTSSKPPTMVRVQLLLQETSPIFQQFCREVFVGAIERQGNELYYCAKLRDPTELKPLLRSYYQFIRICPGEHDLDRQLHDELERMRVQYGTVP